MMRAALLLALGGCASTMVRPCVPPGTVMPLGQVIAQAERLNGCEVSTVGIFLGAGLGAFAGTAMNFGTNSDQTMFRVCPPEQLVNPGFGPPVATEWLNATIANERAAPLFSIAGGTPLLLHGVIEYRGMFMAGDVGALSRLFHVWDFRVAAPAPPARVGD